MTTGGRIEETAARAPPPRRRLGRRIPVALLVPAGIALAFLVLPLVGLLVRAPWSTLGQRLTKPGVLTALRLSLEAATIATIVCILVGVPLAWLLARVEFPGRKIVRALVTVPLVLPPVVGGVALLLVFGRRGLVGSWIYATFGISFPFTPTGVIIAEAFVAMPFLVIAVEGALRGADSRYEEAAATLGARRWTTFRRVTLPLVAPGIAAGAVLCWARALGEFGATITFAGNYPGRTQTMPLAVYLALETDLKDAIVLSLILLFVSVAILVSLRDQWLTRAVTPALLDSHIVVDRGTFRLDLTLTIAAGEVVALLGPNGAGKTTALRALAGLLPVTARTHHPRWRADRRPPYGCVRRTGEASSRRRVPGLPPLPPSHRGARTWRSDPGVAGPPGTRRTRPHPGGCIASAWPRSPTTSRADSPAGRPSASPWPARSRSTRSCCCSTSRSRRWMPVPA